jgi:hypothetical protein
MVLGCNRASSRFVFSGVPNCWPQLFWPHLGCDLAIALSGRSDAKQRVSREVCQAQLLIHVVHAAEPASATRKQVQIAPWISAVLWSAEPKASRSLLSLAAVMTCARAPNTTVDVESAFAPSALLHGGAYVGSNPVSFRKGVTP